MIDYIDFIQCIFPKMIQKEINYYKKKLDFENCKKDILDSQRNSEPRFKLPMFLGTEMEEECNNIGLPYLQNCSCVNFIQFIKNL